MASPKRNQGRKAADFELPKWAGATALFGLTPRPKKNFRGRSRPFVSRLHLWFIHESARTTSKTLAREGERQRRRELAENWNRIEERSLPPTITEAAKRWLEKRASLAAKTLETYQGALKHVRASLGTMLVCDVEARDIVVYQRGRLAQGASGATINKEIFCLSLILSDHGTWGRVRRDVKKLEENQDAGRALSRDEENRLLSLASIIGRHQGNWTPLYTATFLGLNTGKSNHGRSLDRRDV